MLCQGLLDTGAHTTGGWITKGCLYKEVVLRGKHDVHTARSQVMKVVQVGEKCFADELRGGQLEGTGTASGPGTLISPSHVASI